MGMEGSMHGNKEGYMQGFGMEAYKKEMIRET
jgi:hypothetical protein